MFDPKIAVELRALTCAMKAKANRLSEHDIALLLRDVLVHRRGDDAFIDAVLDFEAMRKDDAFKAGVQLHVFLANINPTALTLTGSETEAILAQAEAHPHYDWQNRVDLNG